MYAYMRETGCGFFEGCAGRKIGHLLFATRPRHTAAIREWSCQYSVGAEGCVCVHREPRRLGLTRLHGPIRVKRSGSVKGVKDGQERQALLA
jgi:hypothetical protein